MTPLDPDERALSRSTGSVLSSWRLELCLGKENAGASKDFFFFKLSQQKFYLLAKIHLAKQLEHQKLPQAGKLQCLPLAEHRGR
jgi:hypothetical protein